MGSNRVASLLIIVWLTGGVGLRGEEVPDVALPSSSTGRGLKPVAHAGPDIVVQIGQVVRFEAAGASPDDTIVEYAWDFDADGQSDAVSPTPSVTTHTFTAPGDYACVLTVKDSQGRIARATKRVVVTAKAVSPADARKLLQPVPGAAPNPADGERRWYAVILNGGGESRYWVDVQLTYDMLTSRYGYDPADIYVLNYNGTDPDGGNPNGMIDRSARRNDIDAVIQELAGRVDADDEVSMWITDHGRGYSGPLSEGGAYLGYVDGRISVDPGDEPDFLESDFKLRSLFTGGDYRCNHGLNVWKVRRQYSSATKTQYYRNQYVSRLDGVFIEGLGNVSDSDVYLERLVDYLAGDTNRDGYVDTTSGEVLDFDGDGQPPYDHSTGTFDEDDWGVIDQLYDDYNSVGTMVPENGYPYKMFDEGFQGKVCIDLGYTGGALHVDGRDEDNAGLFDWMDVNQDGDTNDIVSVDEALCIYGDDLYDDELADLLGLLSPARLSVVAEPCFSGGLIEDLTSSDRVIATATIEEAVSWGDTFIRAFVAAMAGVSEQGTAVDADADENGYVSMMEAFNYAAAHDPLDEIPQYDDNGDGVSHTDPVPAGGDGELGSQTYLGPTPPVLHHFTWDPIASPVMAGVACPVRVTARDYLDTLLGSFTGTVQLRGRAGGFGEVAIGVGTYGWSYPLGTNYHDSRMQVIYLAEEIGSAGVINSLALEVTTVPGQTMQNWTIRMKHTPLSVYASATWESTDWTVVYQQDETITQTGRCTFTFTNPFAYNGQDHLMVDFSFNNSSYSSDGICSLSAPGGNRSLARRTDSLYGDPLTWSGSTPSGTLYKYVPDIRLTLGHDVSVEPATAGPFVDGCWSGSIRVLEPAAAVVLIAEDDSGHMGSSAELEVRERSLPDLDGDGDVDAEDFDLFQECDTGPSIPYGPGAMPAGCTLVLDAYGQLPADLDGDTDVDQLDFAVLQRCFSGEGNPVAPDCLD